MKRATVFILAVLTSLFAGGQSVDESLLFSQEHLFGSARYVSLAGSMSALGNDFSSIHDNPAGLSVFRRDRAEVALSYGIRRTSSEHYGQTAEEQAGAFNLPTAGLVKSLKSLSDDLNRFSFGITYRRMAQFDQEILIQGRNPESSVIDQWIANSNGLSPDELIPAGLLYEGMAWEGFLTDVADSSTWAYTSFATGLDLDQQQRIVRDGSRDELMVSFAGSHDHRLFYGLSIGVPFLNYTEEITYAESGFDANSTIDRFDLVDRYNLTATGVNFNLGVQYRLTYWWRVGVAYRSPTWYATTGGFDTELNTNFRNGGGAGPIAYFNDQLAYGLTSPQRFLFSTAFVMGQQGFINIEYRTSNLRNHRLRSDDFDLDGIEQAIDRQLQREQTIRIGGEYVLENISLRAGYAMSSSPYSEEGSGLTLIQTMALGAGYAFSKFKIDVGWRLTRGSRNAFLYSPDFVAPSRLGETRSVLVAGMQFAL